MLHPLHTTPPTTSTIPSRIRSPGSSRPCKKHSISIPPYTIAEPTTGQDARPTCASSRRDPPSSSASGRWTPRPCDDPQRPVPPNCQHRILSTPASPAHLTDTGRGAVSTHGFLAVAGQLRLPMSLALFLLLQLILLVPLIVLRLVRVVCTGSAISKMSLLLRLGTLGRGGAYVGWSPSRLAGSRC